MKLCEMGMRISPTSDGLWALAPETAARGRHRDAAAPRLRHRLHAARGRADDGRRGQRDRHRERVRRPLPVRRRARPHGRRRADRGPARDRARRRPALGRARCRPPTCGPARPSCSPGSSPTARRWCTTASTSSGATPISPAELPGPRRRRRAPRRLTGTGRVDGRPPGRVEDPGEQARYWSRCVRARSPFECSILEI